jgi:hypothetical protein
MCFKNGGTGLWPVPSGVPPDGTRTENFLERVSSGRKERLAVSGGTPETTGQRPVPPRILILKI